MEGKQALQFMHKVWPIRGWLQTILVMKSLEIMTLFYYAINMNILMMPVFLFILIKLSL
jgi:hypothetical protein